MNKYVLTLSILILSLITICIIYAERLDNKNLDVRLVRNTDGTLSFSVRTATYNGPYAPNNAGAIWITDANNQFVKTIKVWASIYRYTLVKWIASSGNNTSGAITGASLTNHQLHNVSWNATNVANNLVADGDYKINIEFTEHNATTNNPGKYKAITFTKGTSIIDLTPPNETYFRDMHLVWEPVIPANGFISGLVTDSQNHPIAGATLTADNYFTTSSSLGYYSLEVPAGVYSVICSATGFSPYTQNNVVVQSGQTMTVDFHLDEISNIDSYNNITTTILIRSFPNPFNTTTSLRYFLPKTALTTIQIFNIRGQKVKSLLSSMQTNGWHTIQWNGTDTKGNLLPSGQYVCRISSNEKTKLTTLNLQK